MPRFTQDQPFDSELNKNSQDSLRQNLLSNIENVSPVDGVILPGGDIGIIKSENVIIPIKKDYDYAGTVNQDGFLSININANADKCLVNIDGQPSYRTTPTKFVFSISDIIGVVILLMMDLVIIEILLQIMMEFWDYNLNKKYLQNQLHMFLELKEL